MEILIWLTLISIQIFCSNDFRPLPNDHFDPFILFLQEDVLRFIYDSYHDQTGTIEVPKALQMKKDLSDRREIIQMKGYRTNNRYACEDAETLFIAVTYAKRASVATCLNWVLGSVSVRATHTHTNKYR